MGVGTGQRNRKRALPPKMGSSPLTEADPQPIEGRKSESEAVLAPPLGLEAVTPPPQRRKSMAGISCLVVGAEEYQHLGHAAQCIDLPKSLLWLTEHTDT